MSLFYKAAVLKIWEISIKSSTSPFLNKAERLKSATIHVIFSALLLLI